MSLQSHQIMMNQANMTQSKKTKKVLTDPKETKINELPDKEFRLIISKKTTGMQENTDN